MSVGLAISKSELDSRAGDICRGFQQQFRDVGTLKAFLDQTADADLVALGYTQQEVTTLKSAFADLATLAAIWTGTQAQTTPYDFRTFVRDIWGVGAF